MPHVFVTAANLTLRLSVPQGKIGIGKRIDTSIWVGCVCAVRWVTLILVGLALVAHFTISGVKGLHEVFHMGQ